jgi:hypothetical protein
MAVAWSLATILLSRAVAAQPPPSTVVLTFDAGSDAQKQAIEAIRAHMSGLPVNIVTVPAERDQALNRRLAASGALAASRGALGTFDIEVASDDSLLIFFTEADGEATLIRRLPPNHQGSRVAFEQVAIVVRSLVEALLDGGNVGIAPSAGRSLEPAPVARETTPTPRSARDASNPPTAPGAVAPSDQILAITAGSTTTQFVTGVAWQSGFSAGVQWLAAPTLYAGARYTFFPTLTLAHADAVVSLRRYPLEALVGYRETGRIALNAELGVVMDRVTRRTVSTAATLRATAPDARWLLAVAARGGFSWSPWKPLRASMRLGADFALMRYGYAVESGESALSLSWVRPRVELELAACLW